MGKFFTCVYFALIQFGIIMAASRERVRHIMPSEASKVETLVNSVFSGCAPSRDVIQKLLTAPNFGFCYVIESNNGTLIASIVIIEASHTNEVLGIHNKPTIGSL
ncbi:hypothetical protein DdX_08221 [Ditylenchus destructor]|uniref:Uncharacterized protein n=1 Tax=Ditylenchus destructor TaxID=166010 RepID=A0AAD4N2Q5_9BILA|nr:hypothetical protein DdX_08221 [Ditylenchus destructor]